MGNLLLSQAIFTDCITNHIMIIQSANCRAPSALLAIHSVASFKWKVWSFLFLNKIIMVRARIARIINLWLNFPDLYLRFLNLAPRHVEQRAYSYGVVKADILVRFEEAKLAVTFGCAQFD